MKVLVTGGAGFIGSNYVRQVVDGTLDGISSVTVLDKLTYAGNLANLAKVPRDSFEFIRGDICDQDLVNRLAKRHDAIINFAAESHVDRSIKGAREFVITNVAGTQTLLDAAREGGVKTFVQISTDEVYGSVPIGSSTEVDLLLPNSPYAASKASGDLMARSYFKTHGLDIRTTRSSNNYGPFQYPEKIIPLFVTNILDGLKVNIYGSGTNVRDWLHVDDNCRGIHAVLTRGRAGEVYNVGGGTELSNFGLTNRILSVLGKSEESINYVEDRLGHDLRYSVDITKISNELGYKPTVDFETGLKETIDWYRENELWWRPLKKE
jgi:dTDP-glucose 4,6-dehydratase